MIRLAGQLAGGQKRVIRVLHGVDSLLNSEIFVLILELKYFATYVIARATTKSRENLIPNSFSDVNQAPQHRMINTLFVEEGERKNHNALLMTLSSYHTRHVLVIELDC